MTRYIEYLNSEVGFIKIAASGNYLLECKIVTKPNKDSNPNKITNKVINQLKQFFDGKLKRFDIPIKFDNTFSGKVYEKLFNTKMGQVITYKKLGETINSKAYRAIGSALSKNPIGIIVPCHRVIKSNGQIGNYTIGKTNDNTTIKQVLLDVEKKNI